MEELGPGPVLLDTAIFIYYIEENPAYLALVEPVFAAVAGGTLTSVTSELTLLEVLVVPYRLGDLRLAAQYEALLSRSAGLLLVPVDRALLRAAAHLRATTGLKTPDAIQLAAAEATGCTTLLTNDRDYRAGAGVRVLQLGDFR
jgi:predicted nucleic acid-binding protein